MVLGVPVGANNNQGPRSLDGRERSAVGRQVLKPVAGVGGYAFLAFGEKTRDLVRQVAQLIAQLALLRAFLGWLRDAGSRRRCCHALALRGRELILQRLQLARNDNILGHGQSRWQIWRQAPAGGARQPPPLNASEAF